MPERGAFFLHAVFSIGGYIVNMQEKSEAPSGRESISPLGFGDFKNNLFLDVFP